MEPYSGGQVLFSTVDHMDVPPDCFIPQPDVDSSVIRLDLYKTPPVELKRTKIYSSKS